MHGQTMDCKQLTYVMYVRPPLNKICGMSILDHVKLWLPLLSWLYLTRAQSYQWHFFTAILWHSLMTQFVRPLQANLTGLTRLLRIFCWNASICLKLCWTICLLHSVCHFLKHRKVLVRLALCHKMPLVRLGPGHDTDLWFSHDLCLCNQRHFRVNEARQ